MICTDQSAPVEPGGVVADGRDLAGGERAVAVPIDRVVGAGDEVPADQVVGRRGVAVLGRAVGPAAGGQSERARPSR